jgi:metal-responsive CopG/Arc/MetJ family transcriptional regulator
MCANFLFVMKVKASVTLSEDLMSQIDAQTTRFGNRSAFIEQVVRHFLAVEEQRNRDAQDLEIFNAHAESLNEEAADVLSFQVDL